ncbi:MAG: hypothetical protein GY850_22360 [bacterium]|nr:hypothetical protein [bacterium]
MFSDHFPSKNKMRKLLISVICALLLANVTRIANGEPNFNDNPDTRAAVDELKNAYSTDVIMGKPMEVDELKIIPLATVGAGIGQLATQPGVDNMRGAASLMIPAGVIVVSKKGVKILQLSKGFIEQLFGALASVILQMMNIEPGEKNKGGEIKKISLEGKKFKISQIVLSLYSLIVGLFLLGWFVLALLIGIFLPNSVSEIASTLRHDFVWSGIIGSLFYGVAVLLTTMFALSLFGIPLAFVIIILTCALTMFGTVGIASLVGRSLANAIKRKNISNVVIVLIGGTIMGIVGIIPVLGWISWTIVGVFGFGVVLRIQYAKLQKQG